MNPEQHYNTALCTQYTWKFCTVQYKEYKALII